MAVGEMGQRDVPALRVQKFRLRCPGNHRPDRTHRHPGKPGGFREGIELIRSGAIGPIRLANAAPGA